MKNYEVYSKNPLDYDLINNGVSKVAEIKVGEEHQLKTLRFELETFVCDGEYARGLERILGAYLDGLAKPEQQAAWVSGFFGSGKSHLVKMLRYLWVDHKFADGASARSIAVLPSAVKDMLVELTNRGRSYGGLKAAAGTLGAGSVDNVRLAFLQLLFRAAGLPENLSAAKFTLWLREKQLMEKVSSHLKSKKLDVDREIRNFYVSTPLAEALVVADPSYGTAQNAQAAIRSQFPTADTPTIDDTIRLIQQIFGDGPKLPCTLIVVDEVQQYIGDKVQRAMDVQELAEACCRDLQSRLLLVGTGQSALTGTASLSRLQARFSVKVSLSDADVENVIRKTILLKKPERSADIEKVIEANSGEISRHLRNTRIAPTSSDEDHYAADYPLLPARRRLWERILRNVDVSGTTAQLRTQLKIVFDAARDSADKTLGEVVPGDFIYDQVATDLLNTGILQREHHETILGLRDGTPAGELKSRLCALMFLISQLPHLGAADDGVRATSETLADLLVEDLKRDGAKLRQHVPKLLAELAADGKAMQVGEEFLLQTREGAHWNHEFNKRRADILKDDTRIGDAREEKLGEGLTEALRSLSLFQGSSRVSRKLDPVLSTTLPPQPNDKLVLWMRHGWTEQEKTVLADARAAGSNSPMVFGFLPRVAHDELKQHLASFLAAQETLDILGAPGGEEGRQARKAIETQKEVAEQGVSECIHKTLAAGKLYLGGGNETTGLELVDRVREAGENALHRLFPQFADADHANWPQVLNRARAGDVGALQAVGYQGETVRHPVCKAVYDLIGPGKKGRDVREHFKSAPYGWPQDAIDASLVVLTLAGNIRATLNGQPTDAKSLNQTQIGNAAFHVDVPPLTVTQRLEIKALFQKMAIPVQNGQESAAAALFLSKLLELAESAGGEPPAPERPDTQSIRDLQLLSGNAQLLEIHKQKDAVAANVAGWAKTRDSIASRLPVWQRLQELESMADGLPEAAEVTTSMIAMESTRSLLAEPDPAPPLVRKLLGALRVALNDTQSRLVATHKNEQSRLDSNAIWQRLKPEQQQELADQFGLQKPRDIKVSSDEDILTALREASLSSRRTMVDALPERFRRALEQAVRLLEPKATRVSLAQTTIKNEKDLETWLNETRTVVKDKLKEGPVILG